MVSANSSILQLSSRQSVSSLKLVKGYAVLPQIHIIWTAFWFTTLPCGSSTTSIGFLVKCHTSLIYLMTAGSSSDGWNTEYHGITPCKYSNCFCLSTFQGVDLSTTGIHTTSYWLSGLDFWCRDSMYIWSRIESSSWGISRSVINSNTIFLLNTSMLACLAVHICRGSETFIEIADLAVFQVTAFVNTANKSSNWETRHDYDTNVLEFDWNLGPHEYPWRSST